MNAGARVLAGLLQSNPGVEGPVLGALRALRVALGLAVGRIEKPTAFDSIFALFGIALTGILVAGVVQSLKRTHMG